VTFEPVRSRQLEYPLFHSIPIGLAWFDLDQVSPKLGSGDVGGCGKVVSVSRCSYRRSLQRKCGG